MEIVVVQSCSCKGHLPGSLNKSAFTAWREATTKEVYDGRCLPTPSLRREPPGGQSCEPEVFLSGRDCRAYPQPAGLCSYDRSLSQIFPIKLQDMQADCRLPLGRNV